MNEAETRAEHIGPALKAAGWGKMPCETQRVYFLAGAPAFMRGKERFSAPKKVSTLIMRFSAGLAKSRG
jgi:hypothetical protein